MRSTLLVVAVLLVFGGVARADQVTLKNGEKLIGTVKALAGGKLTLNSQNAGDVTVPQANIVTFATDAAIEIHFKDATVINQKVQAAEDGFVAIEKEGVLEAQKLAIADITEINPPKEKWTGSISGSYLVTRGNSQTSQANIAVDAVRRSKVDRLQFGGAYTAGRQTDPDTGVDTTTARFIEGSMQYDYFFTDKLYGLANAKAQKDAVADLDLRLIAGLGAGYQWIESEEMNFDTEAGIVWFSENFSNTTPDDDHLSLRIAYHYDNQLNKGVKFIHDVEWYPSLESRYDQLVLAAAGLNASLTESMFAQFKVEYSWDSTPAAGKDRVDVRYLLGVGWNF
ncbi:MAG: DUF481 domain-containing protein [Planctomycetota bacterium]